MCKVQSVRRISTGMYVNCVLNLIRLDFGVVVDVATTSFGYCNDGYCHSVQAQRRYRYRLTDDHPGPLLLCLLVGLV